jgi:hypothetical protein
MYHLLSNKTKTSIILLFMILSFVTGSCQDNQNTKQKPQEKPQEKPQAITAEQTQQIKKILSSYNPSKLTADEAKAIQGKFRDAGIHAGPETNSAIIAAGFDPDKLRILAPPPNQDAKAKSGPPSMEERLKQVQENIIKPLALTPSQAEVVSSAFKDFYTEMDKLKKAQANPQAPLEKSKVEPLEKARDAKIKQVVTTGQYTKYLELEKATRPKRPDDQNPKQK